MSSIQDQNVIGDVTDDTEVVGYKDIRYARLSLMFFQQIEYLGLNRHIKRRYSLVGHNETCVASERTSQCHPLLLTATQLAGVAVKIRGVQSNGS
jgi:hypothetical protein